MKTAPRADQRRAKSTGIYKTRLVHDPGKPPVVQPFGVLWTTNWQPFTITPGDWFGSLMVRETHSASDLKFESGTPQRLQP